MALKSRVVLGIAVIMALSLIAVLPPSSCDDAGLNTINAIAVCGPQRMRTARTHARVLAGTANRLRERLDQLQLADSVRARSRAGRSVSSTDGSVVVMYETPLTADSARVWLNLAVGERDRIPGTGTRTRVVLVLESNPASVILNKLSNGMTIVTGEPSSRRRSPATRFVSATEGDTACIVALRLNSYGASRGNQASSSDHAGRYGSFLGWCGLAARYGAPGRALTATIRYAFEGERSSFMWSTAVRAPDQRAIVDNWRADYRVTSCVNGDAAACPALVGLDPWDADILEFSQTALIRDFVSYLSVTRSPEAFSRYWRSPDEGAVALERSFGQPSEELVREWAQRTFEIVRRDEGPPRRDLMLSAVGWFSAALIAAFAIGMRRQASL